MVSAPLLSARAREGFDHDARFFAAAIEALVSRFRKRVASRAATDGIDAFIDAELALDERSDVAAARAWVGVFAESLADPVLTFIVGALVFGAFAPRKTAGFAAPALRRMARALR